MVFNIISGSRIFDHIVLGDATEQLVLEAEVIWSDGESWQAPFTADELENILEALKSPEGRYKIVKGAYKRTSCFSRWLNLL